MPKRVSAKDAKKKFGGLLEDVAALGRVDIVKHRTLVPGALSPVDGGSDAEGGQSGGWGETHMIPAESARAARILKAPIDFDED